MKFSTSLKNYSTSAGGGLEKKILYIEHDNCCVMEEANGNTTVVNPSCYLAWDESPFERPASTSLLFSHPRWGFLDVPAVCERGNS